MENKLQVFENEEFGKVRVVEIDGVPWFVGKDVATILGYDQARKAILAHVDEDDGMKHTLIDSMGRKQLAYFINESGLYSLMLSSKLPTAKKFKRWVTSEILPSIRRHGAYVTDETLEKILESPVFASRLFRAIADERQKAAEMEARVAELAPKARYFDAILQCVNAMPVSLIAKDYGMSAAAFNKLLHGLRVQYKLGDTWLLYQQYAGEGYTVTRTYHVNEDTARVQTYWTQRGRIFLFYLLMRCGISPISGV